MGRCPSVFNEWYWSSRLSVVRFVAFLLIAQKMDFTWKNHVDLLRFFYWAGSWLREGQAAEIVSDDDLMLHCAQWWYGSWSRHAHTTLEKLRNWEKAKERALCMLCIQHLAITYFWTISTWWNVERLQFLKNNTLKKMGNLVF